MKKVQYMAMPLLWLLSSYSIFILIRNERGGFFEGEDGFFETATAIWFLMAAISFFYLFFRNRPANKSAAKKVKKNVFFLLLGLMFLFCFGEEISWGQRILNIQTPEIIKELNVQNEINIHNLSFFHGKYSDGQTKTGIAWLLSIETLFTIFWLSYCFLIPIVKTISPNISNLLEKINLPIVPIWIGVLFVLNGIISEVINQFVSANRHHYLIEIKESNFAFLFFLIGVWFIKNYQSENKTPQPDATRIY